MAYDNAVYGMKFRKWFNLPETMGGDAADGFALGSGDATYVASWYPDKPIKITKFGLRCLVTMSTSPMGTSNARRPFHLGRQGFKEAATIAVNDIIASLHVSGDFTKNSIASVAYTSFASKSLAIVHPSSLVCIKGGSICRPAGTALSKSTNAAYVAFFVDYTPQYSSIADNFWTD